MTTKPIISPAPETISALPEKLIFRTLLTSTWFIAALYLSLLTLAEVLVTYLRPELGALLHVAILIALLIHSAMATAKPLADLLLTLIIAPLVRLLSLSMPLFVFDLRYWYLIVSIPLFISAVYIMRLLGYSMRRVGFNFNQPLLQIGAILFGIIFGVIEFAILRPAPLIQVFTPEDFAVAALMILIGTGLMEELVFRGIIQQAAERALGATGSILFTTLVFTVLHIGWNSLLDLLFVFTAGAIWGIFFYRTRSIVGITISHAITNILLFIILPLLF